MKKEIIGYKSFDNEYKNISGSIMEVGKIYHIDGNIKYGINGNGYHFSKRLEDTLRYQKKNEHELINPPIALVKGYGTIKESNKLSDEYFGYFDSFAASDMEIIKYLTENEIIEYALKLNEYRLQRFVSFYKLSDTDMKKIKNKFMTVDLAILYYQKKQLDIYKLYYESLHHNKNKEKIKQLINNI